MKIGLKKWLKILFVALVILILIALFASDCGDGKRDDALIAQEMASISQLRSNIGYLHQRCLIDKTFKFEYATDLFMDYRCQGAYPQMLSLDDNNQLTNNANALEGKPLGLLLEDDMSQWSTKATKKGKIEIRGPASNHIEGGYLEINKEDYWVYDPQDGTINFYDNGLLKGPSPF